MNNDSGTEKKFFAPPRNKEKEEVLVADSFVSSQFSKEKMRSVFLFSVVGKQAFNRSRRQCAISTRRCISSLFFKRTASHQRQRFFQESSRCFATKRDWYDVLGVSRGASKQEIKKAYLQMAKKFHPDMSKEQDAVKRFQEASEAWEILGNDDKRAAYDNYGHAAEDMGGFSQGERVDPFEAFRQAFNGGSGNFSSSQGHTDLEDLLNDFFGGADPRGQRSRRNRGPRRGPDVQLGLTLSFMEAAKGVDNKEVEWFEITNDGRRGPKQRAEVDVPPGVDNNMQIRLQGKGGRGDPSAPRGDLYLQIQVEPDDYFERDGPDIHVKVELDIIQATLGATVKILTLDGLVDLTVPPGTQPDAKFRLKNKGLPIVNTRPGYGNQKGAQYAHVHLRVPTKLTAHQRKLLESWNDTDDTSSSSSSSSEKVNRGDQRCESAWRRLRRYFVGTDDSDDKKASGSG